MSGNFILAPDGSGRQHFISRSFGPLFTICLSVHLGLSIRFDSIRRPGVCGVDAQCTVLRPQPVTDHLYLKDEMAKKLHTCHGIHFDATQTLTVPPPDPKSGGYPHQALI
ncbi:CIC11C00000002401 [Sungouiella intermedia]|uniref:CIC11C00000002401 n=1 Tax=Sungouiella intermedia TaxID=45354 RepID=A0A1L0C229_9ASCO|nr:CIC11C00000002401 [[Candida] intermedia]